MKTKHLSATALILALATLSPICQAAIAPISSITTDNPPGSPPYNIKSITVGAYTADKLVTGTTTFGGIAGGELCPENDDFDINTALNYNLGDGPYFTVNFGGSLWRDTNGDAPDFFLFESGGDGGDDPEIQAVFPDGSAGQMVKFPAGWGPTGYNRVAAVANDAVGMNGQQLHGQSFSITDLLDASGNPLTNDTVILGLQFARSGTDPVGLFAVRPPAIQAHDPQPANGATGVLVAGATLSWKTGVDINNPENPNPAITGHYLWLSPPYDPTNPPSADGWWNNAGVQTIFIPVNGATASHSLTLQKDAFYYWVVDESLGAANEMDAANLIFGTVWSFETETTGPVVDAGGSIITWLKEGMSIVDLNATVTDATNNVTGIQWSILASPFGSTVSISDTSVAATTATLDTLGRYILQLYAVDATQQEDSEMIEIQVYSDSCEAAKNHPNGYTAPAYDFNDDCAVNFIDFAMFAIAWLEDAALTEDAHYDAETIFLPPFVQFTSPLNGTTVSGDVVINAISYDEAVGTNDGDGMHGAGVIYFDVFNSSGTEVIGWTENTAPFERTWNTADLDAGTSLPVYPNGVYTIRVTALSDAGYETIKEISVTVNNP